MVAFDQQIRSTSPVAS